MQEPPIIIASGFIKELVDKGIVPPNCRHAIIDANYDNTVQVYFDCFGDERLLTLDALPELKAAIGWRRAEEQDLCETTPVQDGKGAWYRFWRRNKQA